MLFDFEPPTTSTLKKYGVATTSTRDLDTHVKLITFSMVDSFCTSQITSSIAKQQHQKHTRTTDTGQGSLPYSNLLSEIKWSVQMTKTLWPSKQEDNHWFFEKCNNSLPLDKSKDCCGWELKISDLKLSKCNPLRLQCVYRLTLWIAHSQLWPDRLSVCKAVECLIAFPTLSS